MLRLYLTGAGEALLMDALKVPCRADRKGDGRSSPAECDMLGDQMRRVDWLIALSISAGVDLQRLHQQRLGPSRVSVSRSTRLSLSSP